MMYSDLMDRAYPGMKGDSRDDLVESFPVGADLGFGLICGESAEGAVVPGAGTRITGLSLHTHTIPFDVNRYRKTDCASVLRRGAGWAVVAAGGGVTPGRPVRFSTTGMVSDDGELALPNAVFRSGRVTLATGVEIALIELHHPFAA
ncbi:hypothetical protein [Cupriavidus sp. D384]|uniref:structural cement protein Gp24 n=1 Tax=Cupriavidus sp. D384 TaxID=1538095 RepID=UPI000A4F10B5|nr:hypothetical protein [Cupriavidus sp. D384]